MSPGIKRRHGEVTTAAVPLILGGLEDQCTDYLPPRALQLTPTPTNNKASFRIRIIAGK